MGGLADLPLPEVPHEAVLSKNDDGGPIVLLYNFCKILLTHGGHLYGGALGTLRANSLKGSRAFRLLLGEVQMT